MMFAPNLADPHSTVSDLAFALRRAEEESIAQIRSLDPQVAQRHSMMSHLYGERARAILAQRSSC
ncbi:MAG: hypothetical protein ABIO29_03845 [Sphingomicrobium sp.]